MRVVRQLRVQARVDGERTAIGQQDRVAVGRGLRDRIDAHDAVRARLVLDDDRLAHLLAHLLRERARGEVGRAAGKRHDELDRAVRVWRCLRRHMGDADQRRQRDGDERECLEVEWSSAHAATLAFFWRGKQTIT